MNFCIIFSASIVVLLSIALLPLLNTNYFLNWRHGQSSSSSSVVADLLVTNGIIYTSDDSFPFAESMVVRNGRILQIGNYSSVQGLAGFGTKELNLEGKIVVPGFIDSHVHLIFAGLQMMQVEVRGVKRKDEFIQRIKEAVTNIKHGSWVLGGGWNNDLWGGELPMASWIDDITPHNPVWISRMDGHMGLANSLALKAAGITNYTEDPNGGTIMRGTDREPTGLLIDSAMRLVLACIPEVSVDERREALVRASNFALMRGVTTVVDFGRYFPGASAEHPWEDFSDVYRWADSTGEMIIRACLFFPMETWSRLLDLIHRTGRELSERIYLGGVKAFADGSLGSNSALFHEVAIHAIGDRANDLILDMYESVISTNGMRDRRFRVEHAQHLAPGTAGRFGEKGIVASVQPDHLLDDADSAIRKLGMERAQKGSYLFQSLLAGNAILAFGSDWPVTEINPLRSIKTAIKRIPPGWENAWVSSECIELNDALKAYTISAARACFLDKDVGSLSPGKLADFVVLSTDSWDEFASEGSASIEATYVGGVQAYP
ncbi:protein LONG AFTER FAR-RED 3 isoform X3 [Cornus florida]|uniref:protein LONG AFTER FAR-RED 3 isoform X3 n=1 Tax=Cornus florida TaxID=4283 RepID=UPI0028968E5C|nr:protein LONG AFTER FAR-RED 3 isoform X3 [Cornus florida]